MKYEITNTTTNEKKIVSLAEAAEIAGLWEEDIEWAVEEEGRCDGPEHLILPLDASGNVIRW